MRHRPSCVLFDMDGVLLDSEPGSFRMMIESLAMVGIEETLDHMMELYVGKTSRFIHQDVLERHGNPVTPEEFRKIHYRNGSFYAVSDDVKPMEGLVDFLEYLKANGIIMGVVSSTESMKVLTALNRMNLIKYFDTIVCSDMLKEGKPSPEGYLKAAAYLDMAPEDCCVVEDSPIGIRSGLNAGMYVVGYKGSIHVQDTSEADDEAASFWELRELFESLT